MFAIFAFFKVNDINDDGKIFRSNSLDAHARRTVIHVAYIVRFVCFEIPRRSTEKIRRITMA